MLVQRTSLLRLGRHVLRTAKLSSHNSVNAEEVGKFSAVGSDWWDPTSRAGTGPLHALNPVRVDYIRSSVAELWKRSHLFEAKQLEGISILDVGCGGGLLSESLARLGAKVTSIDPSAQNIAVASKHSSRDPATSGIRYKQTTVEEVLASGEKFDVVCALEVIEHVDEPRGFIQTCAQCVGGSAGRPGSLFVSTMNRTRKAQLMAVMAAEHVLGLIPPGTHDWEKFITPDELRAMVENSPLEESRLMKLATQRGIVLQPPRDPVQRLLRCAPPVEWALSATDLDVNYITHFVKL